MRFPLLLACATLLATAIIDAGAADGAPGSVWVEGRWENTNGQYQWQAGYWQSSTTVVAQNAPASRWVEGHWAQGANGWVWIEGHYETAPVPPAPPQQVVVVQQPAPPQQVVVQQPCPPPVVVVQRPPVVVSAGFGYHSYGHGHHRPVVHCPPPVVHCPPPVVHCPPVYRPVQRPVIHRPVVHCPPVHRPVHVGVSLPRPSIGFPTVKIGGHRLPVPVPVPVFRHR